MVGSHGTLDLLVELGGLHLMAGEALVPGLRVLTVVPALSVLPSFPCIVLLNCFLRAYLQGSRRAMSRAKRKGVPGT